MASNEKIQQAKKGRLSLWAAASLLLALCACSCAQPMRRTDVAGLEKRMQELVDAQSTPSVVFIALYKDGTRIERAAGNAQIKAATAAQIETPYLWFSISKLFTAVAVMQLVDHGKLTLDTPVRDVVPEFPDAGCFQKITVRHLLAHTSGLPNPSPLSWIHSVDEPGPNLDEMTARLLANNSKAICEPGVSYRYSNLGYLVLGQVVERVSGLPFEQYMKENVLDVLGASQTGFALPEHVATGYTRSSSFLSLIAPLLIDSRFIGESEKGFTGLNPFLVDGAPYGGLVGPVTDQIKIVEAVLHDGVIDGKVLLSPEVLKQMLTPEHTGTGALLPSTPGWLHGSLDGEPYVYHGGGGGGFKSEVRVYPNLGYGVAVIANETEFSTQQLSSLIVAP